MTAPPSNAPGTNGVPGRATTAADHTDPVIVICALAWQGNPLAGRDATEHYVRRVLTSTLAAHTRQEVLSWRQHFLLSEQEIRWRAAKDWATRLLDTPGAVDLPDFPSPAQPVPAP